MISYVFGNWKSNKTVEETLAYFEQFQSATSNTNGNDLRNLEVILCLPFPQLYPVKQYLDRIKNQESRIKKINITLGAQNVSPFPDGAYTGEVSAQMLQGLVTYCLVGHSERRQYFHETDDDVAKKVEQLIQMEIMPIVCVSDAKTPVPSSVQFIAYEPVWAIGSGKPATPEHAEEAAREIRASHPDAHIIYGGSVTVENVSSFSDLPTVDGVLPGGASLDPNTFIDLIHAI